MITCDVLNEDLWHLVDPLRTSNGNGTLHGHVERCPRCQTRLEEIRRLHRNLECLAQTPTPSLPATIGPYKVIRRIGEGGMGVVYEAEQEEPRRRVALKVIRLPSTGSRRGLRAFQKEIRALSRLRHPSITTIYDAGFTEDGQHYFVMELVDGCPILEYCDRKALPLRDRLALFACVARAVNYAHQRGIIHRDLKPGNILVDDQGDPHVLDFGLVHFTDPEQNGSQTTSVGSSPIGTLPYMSPEQACGDLDDVDVRTDVYALGVLLYEMLTGRLPYDVVGKMRDVLDNVLRAEPARPSSIRRQIDDEVETIILKCLAKERDRRYQSAAELARDIQRYLAGEPIDAKRDSTWYVLKKNLRRHRIPVAVAGAFLLLLASSSVIAWTLKLDADREQEALRQLTYARGIALAQSAYERSNFGRFKDLLDQSPEDLRGWEWNHLNFRRRLCEQTGLSVRHGTAAWGVAISPDAKRIVSAGGRTIKIWDAFTGELQHRWQGLKDSYSVAFHPLGQWMVSSTGFRNSALVWDIDIGWVDDVSHDNVAEPSDTHDRDVQSAIYHPGGRLIITGCDDGYVRAWDAQTHRQEWASDPLQTKILSLACSPDGKRVCAGGDDNVAVLDATDEGSIVWKDTDNCTSVAFSPDARWIISGGWSGVISVRDAQNGEVIRVLQGHTGSVLSVAVGEVEGRVVVVSGSTDNTVGLWDLTTGESLRRFQGHEGSVTGVAIFKDGKRIVSGSKDGTIRTWEVAARTEPRVLPESHYTVALAASPDSHWVVTGHANGDIKVYNQLTDTVERRIPAHTGWVRRLSFSPDGQTLASGGGTFETGCDVKLWDVRTGQQIGRTLGGYKWQPPLSLSKDGNILAVAGPDGVELWDWRSDQKLETLPSTGAIAFSPDGQQLAVRQGKAIVLYDTVGWQP